MSVRSGCPGHLAFLSRGIGSTLWAYCNESCELRDEIDGIASYYRTFFPSNGARYALRKVFKMSDLCPSCTLSYIFASSVSRFGVFLRDSLCGASERHRSQNANSAGARERPAECDSRPYSARGDDVARVRCHDWCRGFRRRVRAFASCGGVESFDRVSVGAHRERWGKAVRHCISESSARPRRSARCLTCVVDVPVNSCGAAYCGAVVQLGSMFGSQLSSRPVPRYPLKCLMRRKSTLFE